MSSTNPGYAPKEDADTGNSRGVTDYFWLSFDVDRSGTFRRPGVPAFAVTRNLVAPFGGQLGKEGHTVVGS